MALPATRFSEILPRTPEQKATAKKLKKEGWIVVTEPEGTFNGAMMLEGPDKHLFVLPDGTVSETYR